MALEEEREDDTVFVVFDETPPHFPADWVPEKGADSCGRTHVCLLYIFSKRPYGILLVKVPLQHFR